jgi:hypothetical protein
VIAVCQQTLGAIARASEPALVGVGHSRSHRRGSGGGVALWFGFVLPFRAFGGALDLFEGIGFVFEIAHEEL